MSSSHVSPSLLSRPSRTVPVTILAVLMVIVGVLAAVAGGYRLSTGALPSWARWARGWMTTPSWTSTPVLVTVIVIAVLTLLCLLWAIVPGRRSGVEPTGPVEAGTSREIVMDNSELTGWVRRWLEQEDGVKSASVKTRGRKLTVSVETDVSDPEALRERITSQIVSRLDSLELKRPLDVRVRFR